MSKTVQENSIARILGNTGEAYATAYLRRQKMRIIALNWRPQGIHHGLEIDIVAQQQGTFVFVEVKTRSSDAAVPVHAAFSKQKQQKLIKAAQLYLDTTGNWDSPCRFDLVCITGTCPQTFNLQHYEHVIELG